MTSGVFNHVQLDPMVWEALLESTGCDSLPQKDPTVIMEDDWTAWTSGCGKVKAWNSFADLFFAQGIDGDPASLSLKDVYQTVVADADQTLAETRFARQYGYPEAIILADDGLRLIRMPNGRYWQGNKVNEGYLFWPTDAEEGRRIETEIATGTLQALNARFLSASDEEQLALKSTMGRGVTPVFTAPQAAKVSEPYYFADVVYSKTNPNARIAYGEASPYAAYYQTQPQNGCVAASILNGAVNVGLPKDEELLLRFYAKLNEMQGSTNGRIDAYRLVDDINADRIPGLKAGFANAAAIKEELESGKAVIALVPYFWAHAISVVDVDPENGVYRAMDTVTGMVVEESLPLERPPGTDETMKEISPQADNVSREQAEAVEMIRRCFQTYRASSDFSRLGDRSPRFPVSPSPSGTGDPSFLIIEFTDLTLFRDWIES